jgi:glucuronokinase
MSSPERATATVPARAALAGNPSVSSSEIRWDTNIPRSVGLAGSSAIVIAVLRALCASHHIALAPDALARMALEVETEALGITAGLQDRIAQAYGGLTFMDFGTPERFEPLDAALLPPVVVALQTAPGEDSGIVHGDLRARYRRGEPRVHEALADLARLAHRARDAVLAGDGDALAACADGSFDARARMLDLDPRHVAMVGLARAAGAGANYAGSGGAIACVCRDAGHQRDVLDVLTRGGCTTVAPRIQGFTRY